MTRLDETHAPALRSWVESANAPTTDFPIQNLPFAVFRRRGSSEPWRGGVAIGDRIVDLAALASDGLSDRVADDALKAAAATEPERFHGTGAPRVAGAASCVVARPARGRAAGATLARHPRRAVRRRVPTARAGRRLHRLLHVDPPRDERRPVVSSGQSAAAELPLGADRLPRPEFVARRVGREHQAAAGTDPGARRCRTRARTEPPHRLRTGTGPLHRHGQRARHAHPDGRGGIAHVRSVPAERLVRARPAGVGVPAARAVPREELRDDALAVDRDDGRARAIPDPLRTRARRTGAARLSRLAGQRGARCHRPDAGSVVADVAHARGGSSRRRGCPPRTSAAARTGRSRSSSRITRSTAATCSRAICWGRARSPDPIPARKAR